MSKYPLIEEKMKKTIDVLKSELAKLRAGRANTSALEEIVVDYYGAPTPITQLGNVSMPEARVIIIQPWDMNILKEIEKAIQKSDIGINPNNNGKTIVLNFPQLTEEKRKELLKVVKKEGEEAKVSIRSIRRDGIETLKKEKKNGEITEDDLEKAEKELQNITDKFISEIEKIINAKEEEVMEV